MEQNPVQDTTQAAKQELSKAVSTTENVVGNPTAAFEPHEFSKAQYSMIRGAKKKAG